MIKYIKEKLLKKRNENISNETLKDLFIISEKIQIIQYALKYAKERNIYEIVFEEGFKHLNNVEINNEKEFWVYLSNFLSDRFDYFYNLSKNERKYDLLSKKFVIEDGYGGFSDLDYFISISICYKEKLVDYTSHFIDYFKDSKKSICTDILLDCNIRNESDFTIDNPTVVISRFLLQDIFIQIENLI